MADTTIKILFLSNNIFFNELLSIHGEELGLRRLEWWVEGWEGEKKELIEIHTKINIVLCLVVEHVSCDLLLC